MSSYKDESSYEKYESSYEKSMGLNTGFISKGWAPDEDIDDSKLSEILRGIEKDVQKNQQTMDLIHGGLFLKKVN